GTLNLSRNDGLVGSGDGTGLLQYRGSIASLNAALDGLVYPLASSTTDMSTMKIDAQADGVAPLSGQVTFSDGLLVVTTTDDVDPGSLRRAFLDAGNLSSPGPTTIRFAILGDGAHTIRPQSPLPPLTSAVLIDGFSQPGYSGVPLVELDGSQSGSATGLEID